MSCFKKTHNGLVEAIVTNAIVADRTEMVKGQPIPRYKFTKKAAWDTGSEITIVAPRLVQSLGLKPTGKAGMAGIGGDEIAEIYTIQLGLPSGDVITDLEVFCGELPDYDLLIGMDVISKTDFLITNKDNTVFSFRYPSEGGGDLL